MDKILNYNRRSLDAISAKAYYHYSIIYERQGNLASIRGLVGLHLGEAEGVH